MLTIALISTFVAILLTYFYFEFSSGFFKRKGIPYIPGNLVIGSVIDFVSKDASTLEAVRKWYNHPAAKNQPLVGIHFFHRHGILVKDLELIKRILINDFSKFSDRSLRTDTQNHVISSMNLFFSKNPVWRTIRQKLRPVFSSAKMKQIFPLVDELGVRLTQYLDKISKEDKCLEVRSICARYLTDVIASFAFGLEVDSLKNPDNEFFKAVEHSSHASLQRMFNMVTIFFFPTLIPLLKSTMIPHSSEAVFRGIFAQVKKQRQEKGIYRNDLIQSLLALSEDSQKSDIDFTDEVLLAQSIVFLIAGYDTSANTMSFLLYHLAKNPEIQKRLRKEIEDVYQREDGKLSYESIHSMEYLEMVLNETLRLYPPLAFVDREVTLETSEDTGYSLQPFSDFVMPKRMPIYIPTAGIHYDPQYFPDPEKFDPERFSAENKDKIVLGSYMPFGLGPRNCIGEKIGLLQVKIGLLYLLKEYSFEMNSKTVKTMKIENFVTTQPAGGVYLDLVKN